MPRERTSIFKNVKTDRGFSASTGLNQAEFNALAEKFSLYYRPTVLVGFPEGFGNDSIFTDSNEALFFCCMPIKRDYPTTYWESILA